MATKPISRAVQDLPPKGGYPAVSEFGPLDREYTLLVLRCLDHQIDLIFVP
jgi:hypothetical protein